MFLHVIPVTVTVSMIILRGFAARKNCLTKNSLETETKQKVSCRFCEHYVSTPVTEKLLK